MWEDEHGDFVRPLHLVGPWLPAASGIRRVSAFEERRPGALETREHALIEGEHGRTRDRCAACVLDHDPWRRYLRRLGSGSRRRGREQSLGQWLTRLGGALRDASHVAGSGAVTRQGSPLRRWPQDQRNDQKCREANEDDSS